MVKGYVNGAAGMHRGKGRNLQMLVVDDAPAWFGVVERNVNFYLKAYGDRCGYSCFDMYTATTPEEGLDELAEHNPALVVLDINFNPLDLESIDGISRFLRPAREKGYSCKVLCWSSDLDHKWPARKAGADEYIEKLSGNALEMVNALDFLLDKCP